MTVAIDDHDVAGRDVGVPNHFVRRRRAIGHEEAVIGVEDARRVALGFGHRPAVVQQLAQFLDRVAHVGTQHVFTKELVEHLANWALQERNAT